MILAPHLRPALVLSFVLFLLDLLQPSHQNKRLPTIYWNASNPIFSSSSAPTSDTHPHFPHSPFSPPVINVDFGESIDISCPLFTRDDPTHTSEYYTLYQVTKEEFDSCLITKLNQKVTKWIFDCKEPFDFNAYTINFVRYSPLPNGLQFEPGQDYYLTSTSTGFPDGLQNLDGGVCRTRGMKLIFRVCCPDNENDLNEQPRIVQLSDEYEEFGAGGVFGGGGGGFENGGGEVGSIGSEMDASAEESRSLFLEETRWRNRITSPVPIPPGKVFPSPKILRVITTQREEENKSDVASHRKWSVLSTSSCTSVVLAVALLTL